MIANGYYTDFIDIDTADNNSYPMYTFNGVLLVQLQDRSGDIYITSLSHTFL